MSGDRIPSADLLVGRRVLEELSRASILSDWQWNEQHQKWVLHCQLRAEVLSGGLVPEVTEWFVLVSDAYPWGEIVFYPAKARGLIGTFPHQKYNSDGPADQLWREGELCLKTGIHLLGRHGQNSEPYDAYQRLLWHFERALKWLQLASHNELLKPGDSFELPSFPVGHASVVVFSEGRDSFERWQETEQRAGVVELFRYKAEPDLWVIKSFTDANGKPIHQIDWGTNLTKKSDSVVRGIWVRLDTLPVVRPWQAPTTWGELRATARAQGVDIDALLQPVTRSIRDGVKHFLLMGFPIPAVVGQPPCQMHWQATMLPVLSWKDQTANGFRPNETGYWQRDKTALLQNRSELAWSVAQNWHQDEILSRGKLPNELSSKHVLLIGCGALGAPIAEMLVRAGVRYLTIVDPDKLAIGNLVRHPLTLNNLGASKAMASAKRLNNASPYAVIEAIDSGFPPLNDEHVARIQGCDLIIDCTGDDEVIHNLAAFAWHGSKTFFSVSLGYKAKRLFCYASNGNSFPEPDFRSAVAPWLETERSEIGDADFPREGVGCWHPIFPARIDDVWMLASMAIKHIVSMITMAEPPCGLIVFEQIEDGGLCSGIRRVSNGVADEL